MRKITMVSHPAFPPGTPISRPEAAGAPWWSVPATATMAGAARLDLYQLNAAGRGRYSLVPYQVDALNCYTAGLR
jgi:hypothetical protein